MFFNMKSDAISRMIVLSTISVNPLWIDVI